MSHFKFKKQTQKEEMKRDEKLQNGLNEGIKICTIMLWFSFFLRDQLN